MPFPTYAKKDDIPKGSEDVYEEKDGKWIPIAPEDVTGLKTSLEKIKQEKADEVKARRKAEDERADLERKLLAAGTGDEKIAKALKKFDDDLAAYKTDTEAKLAAKETELRAIKLDDQAKASFIKAGGRAEKAADALKLRKDSLDLSTDGRIVVKDAKGEVTTETIDDFWGKSFRKDMPEFYTGTKAAGGNAKGGASTSTANTDGKWDGDAVLANPLGAVEAHYASEAAAAK